MHAINVFVANSLGWMLFGGLLALIARDLMLLARKIWKD